MIPTPAGWLRSERRELVLLRSPAEHPVGEIRCHESYGPPRSARSIVAEQLAAQLPAPLSAFTAVTVGAPVRITTDEGEHAAVIRVAGRLGGVPMVRDIGIVFGDFVTVVLDGFAIQPPYFDELDHTVRACVRGTRLMMGVRRRRYVYAMPPGWQGFARGMMTSFIPETYPRNAEHIAVFPAVPRGASWQHLVNSTLDEQIGRFETIEIVDELPARSHHGLVGRHWRIRSRNADGTTRVHHVVLFEDHQYAYPLRFDEDPRARASDAFDALCASVEPLGAQPAKVATRRDRLAVVDGFARAAGSVDVQAIKRHGRFLAVDVIGDDRRQALGDSYHVLYAAHGELKVSAPHVLRAETDRTPVVCELATVHQASWIHVLVAGLSGALRATDALIFPSSALETLYLRVWQRWRTRFGGLPVPRTMVIPAAIHSDSHRRDAARRAAARRELGVADTDVVFATRQPAALTDEEHAGLISSWCAVVARAPRAVLAISTDTHLVADTLRAIARRAGVSNRVIVIARAPGSRSDPTATLRDSADVWLQVAAAVENAPWLVLAAMANELPVIATRVPGIAELVATGEAGVLVDVRAAPVSGALRSAAFGRHVGVVRQVLRHVTADPKQLADAVVALAEDPERRQRLGHHALQAVRKHHELADVTAHRIAMFDEAAARADAEWTSPQPVAPLVDLDEVVGHQASHRLGPTTRIVRACVDAVAHIPEARAHDEASGTFRALAERTLEALAGGARTVAELAAAAGDDEPALAACLARLIAYHVVEIERSPAAAPPGGARPPHPSRLPRTGRDRMALLGGLLGADAAKPHGTNHAAFAYSVGVARTRRYATIDVMYDRDPGDQVQAPSEVDIQRRDLDELPDSVGRYDIVYVAHGYQMTCVPHLLRPRADWTPVVCEVGTTHHPQQWLNLLVASASSAVRATDGVIYASDAARRIHEEVWTRWRARLGSSATPRSVVIANAIDPAAYGRDEVLRASTRRELGLAEDDVAVLSFGRLSPHTKGDQLAIVTLWREVQARARRATLILAGAVADPDHAERLRRQAREAGVGDRVIVVEDPYARWPHARTALMSAADALIHVSTGLEETSSLVILEAMAHGLPVIASRWGGASEIVRDGEDGALIDVYAAPLPHALRATVFGRLANVHAGEASRYAACDGRQLIEAVVRFVDHPEHRRRCGESALRSVRERHSLADAMRRRVEFFDELAAHAEAEWTGRQEPERALFDLDEVVASLGAPPRLG